MEMEVKFSDVKPNWPAKYREEIERDNFHYYMEQQIYSKEFLSFVTEVTNLKEFENISIKNSPDSINFVECSQET